MVIPAGRCGGGFPVTSSIQMFKSPVRSDPKHEWRVRCHFVAHSVTRQPCAPCLMVAVGHPIRCKPRCVLTLVCWVSCRMCVFLHTHLHQSTFQNRNLSASVIVGRVVLYICRLDESRNWKYEDSLTKHSCWNLLKP